MKTSSCFGALLGCTLVIAGCGDDPKVTPGAAGEASVEDTAGGAGRPEAGAPAVGGSSGTAGTVVTAGSPPVADPNEGGASGAGQEGGASGAGPEPAAWYSCQGTEQAFVRRAILGVLGRRPYSQAEVDVYVDMIKQIDLADGLSAEEKLAKPQAAIRHSHGLVLKTLFEQPGYAEHWADLYRDFIKVQRIEELSSSDCFAVPVSEDPVAVAAYVRDQPATAGGLGPDGFSMFDVVAGSVALDDMTPIYTANIFAMLSKTYLGANALPAALELTRRRDFGAGFDAAYLHRDAVCLGCHNSEFSVTQSNDPKTNRHFPVPALLEKSLFGVSTGPDTFGGFEGGDRMHAPLRYDAFVNTCYDEQHTKEEAEEEFYDPGCATPTEPIHYCATEAVCESAFVKLGKATPWGWAEACGRYLAPNKVAVDIAGVEAKFGNLSGLRASPWGLADSLRSGFEKLRSGGLGASPETGEVADPDKAFAYLVAMTIAENVWLEVVGSPLTIPTRFPRNAASRDQLQYLAETFVSSGFSNRKLLEAVFASPFLNLASPEAGCGEAYAAPPVFDPWVIADEDPVKHNNSAADGVASLTSRTAANAIYSALGWQRPLVSLFPDTYYRSAKDPLVPFLLAERQFQSEVGFYLKSSEPGFRGFDFQARLGWEDRFGACSKLPNETTTDFIDGLAASVAQPGQGTARDLVLALKDRLIGRASIDETKERPALEALLGASLDADASALTDAAGSLRKVCGVLASSAQFLLTGVSPPDALAVPKLTPAAASYAALCTSIVGNGLPDELAVTCNGAAPLTVSLN